MRTYTNLEPSLAIKDPSPQDENYKGRKYNVMVEWETWEITEEPLSLIAADDPVTCAVYAKKHDLLHLDGWKRLKHIAKNQKQLTGPLTNLLKTSKEISCLSIWLPDS